jgi:hypothetical protein
MNELNCPVCGSPAVVYPRILDDAAAVKCAECAAFIANYGEFREHVERAIKMDPKGASGTGC